nr:MAG TPA: hypothetical protein [Caudoviricetes sp.]
MSPTKKRPYKASFITHWTHEYAIHKSALQ